ncbi:CPBP family intramembrane glutamic endopeptidase [Enterobacter hormaechei]|uniref:CPBP family intramembrane glutamic endopeptidase n=1 Tax=Enterobacter hormaechei TaxID=158836 RepID=UPI000907FBA2|nr:type II CAAX endopeptidase family protein [Enterobacter hormaechei]
MIIFRHVYPFIYSKKNVIVLFIASVISIIITLSPSITLRYLTLDVSFFLLFIAEFSIAFFLYIFYLRKLDGFKLRPSRDLASIKFSIVVLFVILLVQYNVYLYRDNLYHYGPSHISFIAFIIATFVVPYYEEIIYRGCIFGVFHSIFYKKYIIPCILTSLSFCLMHGQYYNILDQSILFLVSILLLIVRIRSRGLFYPIIIHSCMNAFVLSLNF